VAKQDGTFERHGLDVEFVPMSGGAAILQALSAGSVDIAFSNLVSVQYYEKNVGKLHQLAGGTLMNAEHSEAGLVVRSETGINNLTDLKGKTIAVNALRNIVDLAVLRALRIRGISSSDIRLVELPFKDMETALRAGRIDAATLPEPILTKALTAGGLKNLGDHFVLAFKEIYSTGYFTLPRNVLNKKDVFQRFDEAIIEVTPKVNSYNSDVLKAISESTKVSESDLRNSGRPLFVKRLPDSAMEQMQGWMREEGFIEH
jgi:NitT/TauT family transport system substrate-binding protein